ncbi:MAG: YidB family protein [Moraxella sp.]|uniref:YidB family protein n=1 Tax=Moraxella sp. TaxID=479 RepID=UPI0026DC744D|nr:YidB family protein [Moraxella sp.]MDO4450503.1 YidB family protein [Moraxella sp.]
MSLLQNIVTSVVQNAIADNTRNAQPQGGLGSLLGGLTGQSNNSALGGMLGQVVASQLGGKQSQDGLGGVLGSLLGQTTQKTNSADLGSILSSVLGSQTKSQQSGMKKSTLLLALLPIILGYIQSNGGLSGMLAKFQGNGLNNKAQSWVNIDTDNDGIDAKDILGLFGQDTINHACQQTGASQNDVCQGIAELLPQIVNDLTPNGDLSNESEANAEISQILKQLQG